VYFVGKYILVNMIIYLISVVMDNCGYVGYLPILFGNTLLIWLVNLLVNAHFASNFFMLVSIMPV